MSDITEQVYRAGCERWMAGDLAAAAEHFERALAASPGPSEDVWWFACTRARAQVAMAQDDLPTAVANLAALPDDMVGAAQSMVLRGRLALLRGDADEAGMEVSGAVLRLGLDRQRGIAPLMNGAIALAGAAEVLVELGYGDEARRLVDMGSERVQRAGVDDASVAASLTLASAGAARLLGDVETAHQLLAAIDTSLSTDLLPRVALEQARLALAAGDLDGAIRHHDTAGELAAAAGDVSFVRMLEAERRDGPVPARTAPAPVERWVELRMGGRNLPAGEQPLGYAVVVTLVVDRDLERFLELDDAVTALVDADPDLGEVDGNGTDGAVFELFLDGDDAHALWDAVRPLVEAFGPAPGSKVVVSPFDADPVELAL